MKAIGTGTASGKIILMGEHSVVYGEPAIAFPFSGTGVHATVKQREDESWIQSSFFTGPLDQTPDTMKNVTALLWYLVKHFAVSRPFSLTIDSTIPAERGMGSSAAVATAITRAFFDWQERVASKTEILTFVNQAEQVAHGNPSGIDATTIAGTEPILYQKMIGSQSFPLNMDAYLVVADTGIKGQTRKAVKDIAALQRLRPIETSQYIHSLGALTRRAKEAILKNQPQRLGSCMNQAQDLLKALGASNRSLDHLIDTARKHHALGAKLTGGGRGGCMITLARNKQEAQHLQKVLEINGAHNTWIEGLGAYAHV